MSRLRSPIASLLCALVLAHAGAAQSRGPRSGDVAGRGEASRATSKLERVPGDEAWKRFLERDRSVQFTARTATDARAVLESGDTSQERRAVAWMAWGCTREGSELARAELERAARRGQGLESRAAVLALGELGPGGESFLADVVKKGPPRSTECALLALLRAGTPEGRRVVESVASDAASPFAEIARDLVVFAARPDESRATAPGALLLALRWEAARAFGLVDGQAWPVLRLKKLNEDANFVRDVILRASRKLKHGCVRDHVMNQLLNQTGPGRLEAAVSIMPREVSDLVLNELWLPKDFEEAQVILNAIGTEHIEGLTVDLLTRGLEIPETHYHALALIARTDRADLSGAIDADLSRMSTPDKLWACQAMGASRDVGWQKRLEEFIADPDPDVRAHARVASMMLGNVRDRREVDTALRSVDHEDHVNVVRALCNSAFDPDVNLLLSDYLPDAKGADEIEIATTLTLEGRIGTRARVRKALAADPPPEGPRAVRLVRALRESATAEDRDVLRNLFPRPEELELNTELAIALIELNDQSAISVIQAGLWGPNFDVSSLAGGLLVEMRGRLALRDEVREPPARATSEDLRRVGYAVGEWGGFEELEALARDLRYNSAHPALQGALLGALSMRTR